MLCSHVWVDRGSLLQRRTKSLKISTDIREMGLELTQECFHMAREACSIIITTVISGRSPLPMLGILPLAREFRSAWLWSVAVSFPRSERSIDLPLVIRRSGRRSVLLGFEKPPSAVLMVQCHHTATPISVIRSPQACFEKDLRSLESSILFFQLLYRLGCREILDHV